MVQSNLLVLICAPEFPRCVVTCLSVRVLAKAGELSFLFLQLYIFSSLISTFSAYLDFLHIHDSNLEFMFSKDIIHFIKISMCVAITLCTIFSLNLFTFCVTTVLSFVPCLLVSSVFICDTSPP